MAYSNTIYLVTDDTLPTLELTIVEAETDTAVDVSGASVRFRVRERGNTLEKFSINCVVTDGAAGEVQATFPSGALDAPGVFEAEVEVTFPSGGIQTTYELLKLVIREQIG